MTENSRSHSSEMRRLFLLNLGAGIAFASVLPLTVMLLSGRAAVSVSLWLVSGLAGIGFAATAFWLAGRTLQAHLHNQLVALKALTGDQGPAAGDLSLQSLDTAVQGAVVEVRTLLARLGGTLDEFVPHYRALADTGRYLSARSEDGLQAARAARTDVDGVYQKQKAVMGQVEKLTSRLQDEAAISRELSASLEEMANAIEHSTRKFHETTHSVDQMVDSIGAATGEAEQVARTMERTALDLDGIGAALDNLREGVARSARNAEEVKQDAEQGVGIVTIFVDEMGRIDQESRKAMTAMQRLAQQTLEVSKILEVIKQMVSDTELLAFNAAIIAAKAGAEGRGFSVVAEEIRELADRTAASAGDIESLVKTIQKDTQQVNTTVESTGRFIGRGLELSQATGDALRKIVVSSSEAASSSKTLADQTGEQGLRARGLIEEAGRNLRSVRDISRTMEQLDAAAGQIHAGVTAMKLAADQIARGFDEQVKANRDLDRGIATREEQTRAIFEATRFQMETVARIFEHFGRSEERLVGNAAKAGVIDLEINALEELATELRSVSAGFRAETSST